MNIVNWNINGFFSDRNPDYLEFKLNVIKYISPSFIILTETHCLDNQYLNIDNYKVFQQNRSVVNANARRGSGGIAIAISNDIITEYVVLSVSKSSIDGIMGIKLQNKHDSFKIGIIANYLPPDSYHFGQDPEGYFNELTSMWQDFCDCDLRIGGGDLNARTKELPDFIPEVDGNLPVRNNPDSVKNSHGSSFLTFLKDNRAVILNGRITPHLNNFTFVSTRGSSVPDYFYCPIDNLDFCTEMKVSLMSELVNLIGVEPPQNLPDHSILTAKFNCTYFENNEDYNPLAQNCQNPPKAPRKNIKKMGDSFLLSPGVHEQVLDTIRKIENSVRNQAEIDRLWGEIKLIFSKELDKLPDIPTSFSKKPTKQFRKCKKFWNEELSKYWKDLCKYEKQYLN